MGRFIAALVPQSLMIRIGGALLLSGLLPILVALAMTYRETSSPRAVDQHYFFLLADQAAQDAAHNLQIAAASVQAVAQDGVISGHREDRAAVEDRLRQFNRIYPVFRHLTLVDPEGRTIASSTYLYRGDWKKLEIFRLGQAGGGGISPAQLSPGGNEPIISFAAPVLSPGGGVTGIMVGQIPVASIAAAVTKLAAGSGGDALMVNSLGQIIAHRDPGRLMEVWQLPEPMPSGSSVPLVRAEKGERYLYALAAVVAEGMQEEWRVIVKTPTAVAYFLADYTRSLAVYLSVATFLIIVLVAIGLAVSISSPVRMVSAAAIRMAKGDLSARVEGHPGGELGELASSFNSMAQELQTKVQALQESRARIVGVQERTRMEVAAHLHGRVQGRLLALMGRLHGILKEMEGSRDEARVLRQVAGELERLATQELSLLSRRLYPSILRQGLVPALQSLADQFEDSLSVDTKLDEILAQQERVNRGLVPDQVKLATYRIAEEALTNVVKHARATQVRLQLDLLPQSQLRLLVQDNGQGFCIEDASVGLGWAEMQDYSEAVGGRCSVASSPGRGTEIAAILPLTGPATAHPKS